MRIDKYLKVSRLIKRRTVANEVADAGRIEVNGRPVKASYNVKIGDSSPSPLATVRSASGWSPLTNPEAKMLLGKCMRSSMKASRWQPITRRSDFTQR